MEFSRIRLLSFDCYGTLIDWKKGVLDILEPIAADHQIRIGREELFSLFLEADRKMITGGYKSYPEVLAGIMEEIMERLGIDSDPDIRYRFSERFENWLPFPDTVDSLKKLGKRFKLAVISNTDDDLFAVSNRFLEVEFDYIVTARQLKCYKPSPEVFKAAFERFTLEKQGILHIAQSIHHDIIPTNKLGWNNIWVNRYGEAERTDPAEYPDLEVPDLRSLVRIIELETGI